jgi:hypothetical protein
MKVSRLYQIMDRAYHLTVESGVSFVPYFEGPPGVGKTQKIHKWAKDRGMQLIHFDVPNMSPTDLRVFMPDGATKTLQAFYNEDLFELSQDPDAKALVFCDEVTKGHLEVMKPLIKVINERRMGRMELPRGVMFGCAGNGVIHRSGDSRLPAAFATRMEQYQFDVDAEEVANYFADRGFNPRVSAYLMSSPDSVNRFDPTVLAWPNPRSWERLALKMDYAEEKGTQLAQDEMAADIGSPEATQFWQWNQNLDKLPSHRDVIADPKGTRMPDKISDQFAMVALLVYHADENTLAPIRTYIERMDMNRQVLFVKILRRKKGADLKKVRAYAEWVTKPNLYKLLMDS